MAEVNQTMPSGAITPEKYRVTSITASMITTTNRPTIMQTINPIPTITPPGNAAASVFSIESIVESIRSDEETIPHEIRLSDKPPSAFTNITPINGPNRAPPKNNACLRRQNLNELLAGQGTPGNRDELEQQQETPHHNRQRETDRVRLDEPVHRQVRLGGLGQRRQQIIRQPTGTITSRRENRPQRIRSKTHDPTNGIRNRLSGTHRPSNGLYGSA